MSNIFDKLTKDANLDASEAVISEQGGSAPASPLLEVTPKEKRIVIQELLKYGWLEADRKPNFYQMAVSQQKALNQILEPLDLSLKIDDIRGLAFLVVSEYFTSAEGEDDEWSHPLVRRHRFTLEQSLLVAVLRQFYVAREKETGIGAGTVITLDDLIPQLQTYLGDSGSDLKDKKRLITLLDGLKGHGIVSEVNDKDQVTIRPLITHLANPETLQALLSHFKKIATKKNGIGGLNEEH